MKVKILLAPLLISVIIGMLIWLVYPLYTNGIDGVKERKIELATEKDRLEKMRGKNISVEKLSGEISSNKNMQEFLYRYIPEFPREEEIIDNINYLAGMEGLVVRHLSVLPAKSNLPESGESATQPAIPLSTPSDSGTSGALGAPADGLGTGTTSQAIEPPKALDMLVEFEVRGDYEKMRSLVGKVFSLERFNKVKTLVIKYPDGQKDRDPNNLQMNIDFNFNVMKKFNKEVNVDDPIFSISQLDMETPKNIADKKSTDVLKLNVERAGRNNPFAL